MQPRPVASGRPSEPPIPSGLPVTTAGTEWPACMLMVSIIQAVIWAFVLTTGAGVSRSGPVKVLISLVERRGSVPGSFALRGLGHAVNRRVAPPSAALTPE